MKQATTVLIAAGALLVGGIATAAFMNNRDRQPEPVLAPAAADPSLAAGDAATDADGLPVDTLLRLWRVSPDGHRHPDRPDRQDVVAAEPHLMGTA